MDDILMLILMFVMGLLFGYGWRDFARGSVQIQKIEDQWASKGVVTTRISKKRKESRP